MSQALADDLLAILADPETHEPVALASDSQLQALRDALEGGKARRHDGAPLADNLDVQAALLSQGGKVVYLVQEGIANFLIDERIELDEAL